MTTTPASGDRETETRQRYWVSWWTAESYWYGSNGPGAYVTGYRDVNGIDQKSLVHWIDAQSEADVWEAVRQFYPDAEERFCDEVPDDFRPGDRFPGMVLWEVWRGTESEASE